MWTHVLPQECEQSTCLGNRCSSEITFHHTPHINLHGREGGKKNGKKKKKSTFSPHLLLQIFQMLAQKKAEVIFLSSLVHHESRTGTMGWPTHPGRAPEVSSFLASEDAWAAARVIFNTSSPTFAPARFLPTSSGRYWHGESPPQHRAEQKGIKILSIRASEDGFNSKAALRADFSLQSSVSSPAKRTPPASSDHPRGLIRG